MAACSAPLLWAAASPQSCQKELRLLADNKTKLVDSYKDVFELKHLILERSRQNAGTHFLLLTLVEG